MERFDTQQNTARRSPTTVNAKPCFEEVYLEYASFVWLVLRRLGVARADLEDTCQDVFLVVHRKLETFEWRSSLKTWLYGISMRLAADYRRKHVRPRVDLELEWIATDATQLDSASEEQARAVMYRILDSLEDNEREVFVAYELEELAMSEIAEIIGCPLQTAYSRLHAARHRFDAAVARLRAKEQFR